MAYAKEEVSGFFLHGLAYVSRKIKCGNGVVRWEVKLSCGVTSSDAARASLCHTSSDESRPGIYQLHNRRTQQQETYRFVVYTYSGKLFQNRKALKHHVFVEQRERYDAFSPFEKYGGRNSCISTGRTALRK